MSYPARSNSSSLDSVDDEQGVVQPSISKSSDAASVSMVIPPPPSTDVTMTTNVANQVMKYVSSLDSNTTRWMNKRRPKNSAALPCHVMPSIAVQLKELFDNFDFDQSGEIDLRELKQAVRFVADACPELAGQSHSAQDSKAITHFFTSMDVDHNGVVDFVEFLAAVTTNHSENDAAEIARASRRLQAAFLEFATQLRRQRLAKNLFSDHTSSREKVESLKQLYSINYFVDAGLETDKDPTKIRKQWEEFNGGVLQSRKKKELERTRDAAALLKNRRASAPLLLEAPAVRSEFCPSRGSGYKKEAAAHSIVHVPLPKIRNHRSTAIVNGRTNK
eukprot:gene986-1070_t